MPRQKKKGNYISWSSSVWITLLHSYLCRDQECLQPVAWPLRDPLWGPQVTGPVRCPALECQSWTRPVSDRHQIRSSRSSNRIATNSKSSQHFNRWIKPDDFVSNWNHLKCLIEFIALFNSALFHFSAKKKKMADKILPQRVSVHEICYQISLNCL